MIRHLPPDSATGRALAAGASARLETLEARRAVPVALPDPEPVKPKAAGLGELLAYIAR